MIDLKSLPALPGVYFFKDISNNIIYIGKAKILKNRVKSYFTSKTQNNKTKLLLTKIHSLDYIVTNSELEALILENNLIKKHQPQFNIDLKDSKTYSYIVLTNEKFSRIISVRDKKIKGTYFGPFVSASERNSILNTVKNIFKLRTCKKFKKSPCLRSQIELCDAPCDNKISEENYKKKTQLAKSVLNGNISEVIGQLTQEMYQRSEEENYEIALIIKEQIFALERLKEKQNIERNKKYDEDIINFKIINETVYLMVFKIYRGILKDKEEFKFRYHGDFFEEFILQYYSSNRIPKEIILPLKINEAMSQFLSDRRESNIKITVPVKGEKKNLLSLIIMNIEQSKFPKKEALTELKSILKLENLPNNMECFDISHLMGEHTTASMVCFKDGFPSKENYRRFKIKSVHQIDDPASIAEVVRRRYLRQIQEKQSLPELIIIDGGRTQLNAAVKVLIDLKLRIPIISIAKKNEEIYLPEQRFPLKFNLKNKGLNLIREIRDESHRFAIKYNRLLRDKEFLK